MLTYLYVRCALGQALPVQGAPAAHSLIATRLEALERLCRFSAFKAPAARAMRTGNDFYLKFSAFKCAHTCDDLNSSWRALWHKFKFISIFLRASNA